MQGTASLVSLIAVATLSATPVPAQWSTQSLSAPRSNLVAVTIDGMCLIAGGTDGSPSDVVDIHDDATDSWSTATLSVPRSRLSATVVGQYALFAGGATSPTSQTDVVDVFDSLTGTWSQTTLSQARYYLSATTVGDKAIFAGGGFGPSSAPSNRVDIYDASIGAPSDPAAWSTATLNVPRGGMAATTVGDYALFAGGTDSPTLDNVYLDVDVYDDSTGTWSTAELPSEARAGLAATSVGSGAYFGGGSTAFMTVSDLVDIYDASIGAPSDPAAWSTTTLGVARTSLTATALGNTVLFAGGFDGQNTSDAVDLFNSGTGHWSLAALSQARDQLCATSVGGKALIAGGHVGPGLPSLVVDVYEPVGVNYCLAAPNSVGCAATISASGSASLAADDLVLRSVCVPNQPFIFFHAATQMQLPFGDGFRCAGGDLVRLPSGLAVGNVAETTVDLSNAQITTPGQRNFQCWFRDPAAGGAGFNTSDALAITFVL